MTDLKPCPNKTCKGTQDYLVRNGLRDEWGDLLPHGRWVECGLCDMCGPMGQDEGEGDEFWNDLPRNESPWRPIEEAPKDKNILLFFPDGHWEKGRWQDDRHKKKPRPFFGYMYGAVMDYRKSPATHFMEIPEGPE